MNDSLRKAIWALAGLAVVLSCLVICFLANDAHDKRSETKPAGQSMTPRARAWESLKMHAKAVEAEVWECSKSDTIELREDFTAWAANKPIVPEVRLAIWNWLDSEQESLDTLITNEPTGAEYWITGARRSHGTFCLVKFIGNVHWE